MLEPEDRNLNPSQSSSSDALKCLIVIVPVAGKWNFCKMSSCMKIGLGFDFMEQGESEILPQGKRDSPRELAVEHLASGVAG